jgi:cytochrome b561
MPVKNGDHGYGGVSKLLHWVTVSLILGQFLVGYTMSTENEAADRAADRAHESKDACKATEDSDAAEAEEERCEEEADRREDELDEAAGDDDGASTLHVGLGLAILLMAVLRVAWRRVGGLPPWAEALSAGERTLEAYLEKGLLLLLFLIPISGLLLVLVSDDWLPLHIGTHIAFFVVVGLHVGLVLKHTVVSRDRHLARML